MVYQLTVKAHSFSFLLEDILRMSGGAVISSGQTGAFLFTYTIKGVFLSITILVNKVKVHDSVLLGEF